ncbi:MAG: cyclase family protein [Firmicutes bacterium]|nr:cyclase family protein [Bacillota bacterium]
MVLIDLSIPICDGMQSFPGEPGSSFIRFASLETMGFVSHQLLLYSHGGTHVDAPRHFLHNGGDVAGMALERLIGPSMVADVPFYRDRTIGLGDIQWPRRPTMGDRVLIRTGWGEHWGASDYFTGFPNLSIDVARYLASCGVVLVGLDTPTPHAEMAQEIHEILLGSGIIIVESLVNLDRISSPYGTLICLPLPMVGMDGAPARVVFAEGEPSIEGQ